MVSGGRGGYGARILPHMGIETILIVLGLAIVIAVAVGAKRAKRKAPVTQAPKTDVPSSVRKKE